MVEAVACPYVLGVQKIKISEIRPNPVSLRGVDRKSEKFLGLVASIQEKGFLESISVRPQQDKTTGEWFLELINGLHRYTAAKEVGLEEINVDIKDLDEDQVLEAQIMLNFHKVDTSPTQYSEQLRRILDRNPLMTEMELAGKLGVSPQFIKERLQLTKIEDENIKVLIDEGKIPLMNAYALAKLPANEQRAYMDLAMTQKAEEFIPAVNKRKKELNEANKQGKDAPKAEWAPMPHLRKISALQEAAVRPEVLAEVVTPNMTPIEAAMAALKWAIHLDAVSVAEAKAKNDQREAERAAAKSRREAEKASKNAKSEARKAKEAALEQEITEGFLKGTMTPAEAQQKRNDLKIALDAEFGVEEEATATK